MNLDNEHEAYIVDQLLKNECKDFKPYIIGIRYIYKKLKKKKLNQLIHLFLSRVNPVVGEGKIGMMSTASKLSKFGVPLTQETKDRVLELYKTYPWLNGIHFHVGSQGVPIELFVNGAKVNLLTQKSL